MTKSFFATSGLNLLDRQTSWDSRERLARAMFDYTDCFYTPSRTTQRCYLSPIQLERARTVPAAAA